MANRYWVGGTGNWGDTSSWSTSSGGSSGASVPTSSDDVFLDSNSGLSGATITETGTVRCNNITATTGVTFTMTYGSDDIIIYGDAVFESGMTWASGAWTLFWSGTSTLTTNGCTLDYLYLYGAGSLDLADNLTVTTTLRVADSTFNTNNYTVVANYLNMTASATKTITMNFGSSSITAAYVYTSCPLGTTVNLNMGSSYLTIVDPINEFPYFLADTGGTLNFSSGTSTIELDATGDSSFFDSINEDFYDLVFKVSVEFSGTINSAHSITATAGTVLKFLSNETYSSDSWTLTGTSGSEISILSDPISLVFLDGSEDTTYNLGGGATYTAVGQSFTPTQDFVLDNITVHGKEIGTAPGNFYVKVYAHSGTYGTSSVPTGSPLATSDATGAWRFSSSSYSSAIAFFTGANQITLEQGTNYVLVFEYTAGDASNYVQTTADSTSPSYGGNLSTYNGSWSAVSGSELSYFLVIGIVSHTLSSPSGVVEGDYLDITHSNATGGALWIAKNSTDSGNNTGWNFVEYYKSVTVGAFTLSGITSGLYKTFAVMTSAGSFILSGISTSLKASRKVVASVGSFVLTGIAALLSKVFAFTAGIGSFTLLGVDSILLKSSKIIASAGSFILTGLNATLAKAYKFAVDTGSFILTGITSGLYKTYAVLTSAGSFILTGVSAGLLTTVRLIGVTGSFILTGIANTFTKSNVLLSKVGEFILSGIDTRVRYTGWSKKIRNSSIWTPRTKNSASFSGKTKNSATFSELTKNSASFTEKTKNSGIWTERNKT